MDAKTKTLFGMDVKVKKHCFWMDVKMNTLLWMDVKMNTFFWMDVKMNTWMDVKMNTFFWMDVKMNTLFWMLKLTPCFGWMLK